MQSDVRAPAQSTMARASDRRPVRVIVRDIQRHGRTLRFDSSRSGGPRVGPSGWLPL